VKLVVKPDMLFGQRGKNDLVGLNLTFNEAEEFIRARMNKEVRGQALTMRRCHIVPAQSVPHGRPALGRRRSAAASGLGEVLDGAPGLACIQCQGSRGLTRLTSLPHPAIRCTSRPFQPPPCASLTSPPGRD
jgi:hypothetical protein